MFMLMALAAAASPTPADQQFSRMAALYEDVCLRSFPDDKAVEALLVAAKAQELTPEVVKVTMRDDPARAWKFPGESTTVWLEFPPYHACSVRWNAPNPGNLGPYRIIADRYEKSVGGFVPQPVFETDQGDIHIRATREARTLADGSTESLMLVEQHLTDPKRRASGETGTVVRFVHQFAPAPSYAPTMPASAAQAPSTRDDRERFVSVARKLEAAPLDPSLQPDREWALQWLTDAPDISVTVCADSLRGLLKSKYRYGPEILLQYSFAMAAQIVEHPDTAKDFQAIQLAGIEGALVAYRAILKEKPEARAEFLDPLLEAKARGELPGLARKASDMCAAKASNAMP